MRKVLTAAFAAMAISGVLATGALGAQNPAGSGQPGTANPNGVACQSGTSTALEPAGFSSGGFANAANRYSGSPENPNASGNSHAVSEYDIACYQYTASH
jgi:hypothetical protein